MLARLLLLTTAVWAAPVDEARGDTTPPRWQVELALAGSPSAGFARRGLTSGGVLAGRYRFEDSPWFVTSRGAVGVATAANDAWKLSHTHVVLAVGGGVAHTVGVGTLSLEVGLGGLLVREVRKRHQFERLELARVESRTGTDWSLGPHGYLEGAAALRFVGDLSAVVALGAAVVGAQVDGRTKVTWGPQGRLGIAYAF